MWRAGGERGTGEGRGAGSNTSACGGGLGPRWGSGGGHGLHVDIAPSSGVSPAVVRLALV